MVFDSTISGENANSLASVAQADAHHNLAITSEEWAAVLPENKERNLVAATRMIKPFRFCGSKTVSLQSLPFPRASIYDMDNALLDDDVVPIDVLELVCDLALYLEGKEGVFGGDKSEGIIEKEIALSGMKKRIKYKDSGSTEDPINEQFIRNKLKHYIVGGNSNRLLRG